MSRTVLLLSTSCLLVGLLAASAAVARRPTLPADKPHLAKASSVLLRARELAVAGRPADAIAAAVPAARLRDGMAPVQLSLETLTPGIVERLRAAGLIVDSFHLDQALVYGRIDPAKLDRITAVAEVATIHPMPRRGTRAGTVANQADVTLNADDVRAALGIDGSGVEVGILSDSFNATLGGSESGGTCVCATPGSTCDNLVTGMTNQNNGNLPPSAAILDDCTIGPPNCSFLSDEGAAIGELIFDLAPGAGFLFHSAFNSPGDFAGGITQLRNCGAELIVDDVFWTLQPFFQDGVIAAAAQASFDAGVPYFSAAGNDATFGINDFYKDSNPGADDTATDPSGNDLHDFASGDPFAAITLPDDCSIYAELQWSEPFDGTLGPGAASDLDLYIVNSATTPFGANVEESSVTRTGCGAPPVEACADGVCGDPVEIVEYTNTTGGTDTVFLAIEHFCGDEGVELRVVNISFDCNFLVAPWNFEDGGASENPIFVDAQIFGHPAARDAIAVGAAFYGEIDSGGSLDPPSGQLDVEPFSSLGGTLNFYYDATGGPLSPAAPIGRWKPDVTSVDGTNNSFFGFDTGFDPDGFPEFFGTSAAAPHATALAVLIWQLTGELISPRALHQLIEQAILEMELPGFDGLSGYGLSDAHLGASGLDESLDALIDELEFDLDGESFLTGPPASLQRLQAKDTLTVGDGNYDGLHGFADEIIFADGFESGDTSAWSNTQP